MTVKTHKVPSFLLCVVLLLSLLAGCDGGNGGTTAPAVNRPTQGGVQGNTAEPETQATSNFNATGFPIVNEAVTKNFMLRKPAHIVDPNEMLTFQKYEEMTNVKVNWEVVSADGFSERVNLVMASNTMPDAIIKGVPDVTKTSADGSIIDLTDLIANYGAGITELFNAYPAAREASHSPDGKIYALPSVNTLDPNRTGHRNLWINKTWMDALGLSMPKTMDEYLDVLRAFRDGDPNGNGDSSDEIPYVVEFSGGRTPRVDVFSGSYGVVPNMGYQYAQIVGDKVEITATSEVYKQVLQLMNTMWSEKLLDNAIFTQTSDVALSKFNSSISGSFGLSSNDLWSEYSNDYIALAPPVVEGYDPVIALSSNHGGNSMVITKADQTPEITMRWIDYFYSDEGSRFIGGLSPLLKGETCQQLADGTYEYSDAILNSSKGVAMAVGEMCPLPGGGFPYWRNANNSNFIFSQKVRDSVPVYQSYYQKTPAYAYPVFSIEDSEKVNDIRRDLDVYLEECQGKFITGELSFEKWDDYVATCEKMKIKDLEAYFQAAYDRMK